MEYLIGILLTQLTWMADHPTFTLVAVAVVGLSSFVGYRRAAR